jgi:magnesium chelatase family protein
MNTITSTLTTCVRVHSYAIDGLEARPVAVDIDVRDQFPSFTIVGLGDAAQRETRERVTCALRNSGYELPQRRITINVAPASLRKTDVALDLPIALGILVATGVLDAKALESTAVVGDLDPSGQITAARGTFAIAEAAHRDGLRLVSGGDTPEQLQESGPDEILIPLTLIEAVEAVAGGGERRSGTAPRVAHPGTPLAKGAHGTVDRRYEREVQDLADFRGNAAAVRALQVAAIGRHSVLILANRGLGRTMFASRLTGILGTPDHDERRDIRRVRSCTGQRPGATRPLRAPHHASSAHEMLGYPASHRPGELALADHGVFFLDELCLIEHETIEAVLQAVDAQETVTAHHGRARRMPARALLMAAIDACPCGKPDDGPDPCRCTPTEIADLEKHRREMVYPHFDLVIRLTKPRSDDMYGAWSTTTAEALTRVESARARMADTGLPADVALIHQVAVELAALDGLDCPTDQHRAEAAAIASPTR